MEPDEAALSCVRFLWRHKKKFIYLILALIINKWNGILPTVMTDKNSVMMLPIGDK